MELAAKIDMGGQQIIVIDREQLMYLLIEAAEIEHGLTCSYLYANCSLKGRTDEGLTNARLLTGRQHAKRRHRGNAPLYDS